MMLFHSSCEKWDKKTGPVPRLILIEGAKPEPEAVLA